MKENNTEWMQSGNCRMEPPSTFFPSDAVGVEVAKRICSTCVVKDICLEYALTNRIDNGVWGGASERQRRRILKVSKQTAATSRQVPSFVTTDPPELSPTPEPPSERLADLLSPPPEQPVELPEPPSE